MKTCAIIFIMHADCPSAYLWVRAVGVERRRDRNPEEVPKADRK